MSAERPGCAWCHFADDCGVQDGRAPEHCPIAALSGEREPTMRDVIALLTALQAGVNQRFAQIMLLIERHMHKPGGPS